MSLRDEDTEFLNKEVPKILIDHSFTATKEETPQRLSRDKEIQTDGPIDDEATRFQQTIFFLGKRIKRQNEELEEIRKKLKKYEDDPSLT